MKKVNPVFNPIQISALRLIFAGSVAAPFAYRWLKNFNKRQFWGVFWVGLVGNAIPSFFFAIASKEINSATAGILNALAPIFTLLLGIAFFAFKAKKMHYIGAALGLFGCILVLQGKDTHGGINNMWYTLFPIMGSICYGFSSNIIKARLTDLKPIVSGSVPFLFGAVLGIIALPFSFTTNNPIEQEGFYTALSLLIVLGVFGSAFSMVLFNRLVQLNSALFASTVTFIMPVFAILWGLWDNENVRLIQIVGLLGILLAVYAVRRGDKPKIKKPQ